MKYSAALIALAFLVVGCGGNDSALSGSGSGLYGAPARDIRERENLVKTATRDLAKGVAAKVAEASGPFGFKLISKLPDKGNVVVSPLSVATALSMVANGAVGDTQTEILDSLGYAKTAASQVNEASMSIRTLLGNVDPSVQLRVANSIWAKDGTPFNEGFIQTNERAYGAKTTRLDFAAPDSLESINRWVKEATNGKIETILQALGNDTAMVLLNAVYFKGNWRTQFSPELTKPGVFSDAEGVKRTVPMMNLKGNFPFVENKKWSAVSLPYGNGRIEMVVVLPAGKEDEVAKGFASEGLKSLDTMRETAISLALPKFTASFEEVLNKPLGELGLKRAFTANADFSALSADKLYISEVRHKTVLEVDEVGSEAAAATSITMTKGSGPSGGRDFTVNRPFLLLIREKETGLVLFGGLIRAIGDAPKP